MAKQSKSKRRLSLCHRVTCRLATYVKDRAMQVI